MRMVVAATLSIPSLSLLAQIRLLLGEKGVGYELVRRSPWERRDEFVDLNPAGRTPVMVDGARRGAHRQQRHRRIFRGDGQGQGA